MESITGATVKTAVEICLDHEVKIRIMILVY